MGSVPNTVRRSGTYHFRLGIPAALRTLFKRAEITCSLRTSDPAVARMLSRLCYVCSGELFDRIMSMPVLTDRDIKTMIRDFYQTLLTGDDVVRLYRDVPVTEADRSSSIALYRDLSSRSRMALATNNFSHIHMTSAALIEEHLGRGATLGKVDQRKLQQALLRASIEVAETFVARLEGDFNYEPADKLLVAALEDACSSEAEAQTTRPIQSFAAASPSPAGPLFNAYAAEFRTAQTRRGKWEEQTSLQARKTFALFSAHAGDRPLGGYLRTDAHQFKALLQDLPADYGKAAKFRGMSAADIVAATKEADLPRLSARTVQRHFHALATLWDQAVGEGLATDNIFHNWKFGSAKRARDQRAMWERAELEKLFESPVWTGSKSEARRSTRGERIIRDERFWLPLIAVFSGMRQEEICQLRPADVREVEGVWVFDVNDRDGQQLKNNNAVRLVPVHPELIKLGWLEYVETQRKAGQLNVFPNLRPGGADDRLGHNYSKWFTRYRRDVGVYAPGRDFHSLRHSATTFLKRGGVADSVIDELTGHATVGETARYSKGLTVANLKEAIDRLDIGVDLSVLYASPS